MTYLGLFDEDKLRHLIIDRIVDRELDQLTAIKNEDKFDIFTNLTNVTNYNIEVKASYYFWKGEYRQYCIELQEEYNNGLNDEDQLSRSELGDIIDKTYEDREQFRNYLELVKDHIDIFDKEIVF